MAGVGGCVESWVVVGVDGVEQSCGDDESEGGEHDGDAGAFASGGEGELPQEEGCSCGEGDAPPLAGV